jgi:hypothetical protein
VLRVPVGLQISRGKSSHNAMLSEKSANSLFKGGPIGARAIERNNLDGGQELDECSLSSVGGVGATDPRGLKFDIHPADAGVRLWCGLVKTSCRWRHQVRTKSSLMTEWKRSRNSTMRWRCQSIGTMVR